MTAPGVSDSFTGHAEACAAGNRRVLDARDHLTCAKLRIVDSS